jgi:hypothetical protein
MNHNLHLHARVRSRSIVPGILLIYSFRTPRVSGAAGLQVIGAAIAPRVNARRERTVNFIMLVWEVLVVLEVTVECLERGSSDGNFR